MSTRKVKIAFEIEGPFIEYSNEKINKKAESSIKRWIKETLRNELSYIPFYVEESIDGSLIEDCSRKTKIIMH
jgi:hypothetical protein